MLFCVYPNFHAHARDTMTPEEFQTALEQLGWKQSDFCRMADVDKNTPSRWIRGTTPVPGWAPRFLEMAIAIRKLAALTEPPKAN